MNPTSLSVEKLSRSPNSQTATLRLNSTPVFQKIDSQKGTFPMATALDRKPQLKPATIARLQGLREAHPFRQHYEICPTRPDSRETETLIIFVNGMLNTLTEAKESASEIANIFAQKVDLFFNSVEKLETALSTTFQELSGRVLSSVIEHLCMLKKQKKNVWIFAHNDGVMITKHALDHLHPDLRKNISVFAFGGMTLIPGYACGGKVINSYKSGDWMLDVYRRPEFSAVRKRLLNPEWSEAEKQHYTIYEKSGPKGMPNMTRIRKLSDLRKRVEGDTEDHSFKTYLPMIREMHGVSAFRE